MIFSLDNCSRANRELIRRFLNMRPVPQLGTWIAFAEQFKKKNCPFEAALILDLVAKQYGRDLARKNWRTIQGLDISVRGQGCGSALHTIQSGNAPVTLMGNAYAIRGEAITCCNIMSGWQASIDLSPLRGNGLRLTRPHISSVEYQLVVAVGEELYAVEEDKSFRLLYEFDSKILGLAQGLDSGEILVLKAAPSPVFAPDCVILRNALTKPELITLPNIQQRLFGDCAATTDGWITCCGGMQNSEVRFIHTDGSWETRFPHEKRVIRIARSARGPVSIDETGVAFLWDGLNIIDDCKFAVDQLPKVILDQMTSLDASVNWETKQLLLSSKDNSIDETATWLITENSATSGSFLRQLYPSNCGITLAMLGDGQFHFWDPVRQCVVCAWQMPEACAEANEWRALLDNKLKISVDDDPRIRRIVI